MRPLPTALTFVLLLSTVWRAPSALAQGEYWLEPPGEAAPQQGGTRDADRDGLDDDVERTTGTKALRADTDEDGVPDGVEDADRDGVLDPSESDPRVPGLFPGGYPHIPEPMHFDLVRGLGARAGEVEVNTLAVYALRRDNRHVSWAPEVEWALGDGLAIELELPMHDRELEALKSAFQVTMPSAHETFTHGIQAMAEYRLDARETEVSLLYIAGARVRRWSVLGMGGVRAALPSGGREHYEALLNPSFYCDLTEVLTLGLEANVALRFEATLAAAVVPQVHWQITKRVRVQAGAGLGVHATSAFPLIASRVILE